MQLTPQFVLDRFAGVLAAQLLSSQTSGTFQINTATALGSQLATMDSAFNAIVTIENEQILLSAFSVSGATVTATIATSGRGYNGTTAATHASTTAVEIHWTKGHVDILTAHLRRFDDLGMILPLGSVVPTITDANTHVIAGDYTTFFTVGRGYLFKIGSTWYRAVIRSAAFAVGNTTFEITGDGLVSSGTIASAGFEFEVSANKPVDYRLVKMATNVPADSPPAGYGWLFAKAKGWWMKDEDGKVRPLCQISSTAASSGGVLTLDWGLATIYDVTLTENISGLTHQNGVEGEEYVLRIKQHASSAKTVVISGGKTRFSNTVYSYSMTTTVSAYDVLKFLYNATDDKYDLLISNKGFQTSPTAPMTFPSIFESSTTDQNYVSSTAENTMFTTAITGGLMTVNGGLKGKIKLTAGIQNLGATHIYRLKYGGTTIATVTLKPNAGSESIHVVLDFLIQNQAATNAQEGFMSAISTGDNDSLLVHVGAGTAAIDSTANQNLVLTSQFSESQPGTAATLKHRLIEVF